DAKGQRLRIVYGNGARTTHEYDPETFRLVRLTTTRAAGLDGIASQLFANPATLQDLQVTSDAIGNVTRIADAALATVFFATHKAEPVGRFTYDALYRLIEAQGREHVGQSALQLNPPNGNYRDHPFSGLAAQPFDPGALRNCSERYVYDAVGNFEQMIHKASG